MYKRNTNYLRQWMYLTLYLLLSVKYTKLFLTTRELLVEISFMVVCTISLEMSKQPTFLRDKVDYTELHLQ